MLEGEKVTVNHAPSRNNVIKSITAKIFYFSIVTNHVKIYCQSLNFGANFLSTYLFIPSKKDDGGQCYFPMMTIR